MIASKGENICWAVLHCSSCFREFFTVRSVIFVGKAGHGHLSSRRNKQEVNCSGELSAEDDDLERGELNGLQLHLLVGKEVPVGGGVLPLAEAQVPLAHGVRPVAQLPAQQGLSAVTQVLAKMQAGVRTPALLPILL